MGRKGRDEGLPHGKGFPKPGEWEELAGEEGGGGARREPPNSLAPLRNDFTPHTPTSHTLPAPALHSTPPLPRMRVLPSRQVMSLAHKAHNLPPGQPHNLSAGGSGSGENAAGGALGPVGPLGSVGEKGPIGEEGPVGEKGPVGENAAPSEEVRRGWLRVARGFVAALHGGGARYQRALDVVCEVRWMSLLRLNGASDDFIGVPPSSKYGAYE